MNNQQDRQEKRSIAVVLCVMIILILLVLSASGNDHKIGYLVATTGTERIKIHKVKTIEQATEIFKIMFDTDCVTLEKQLKYSDYFQILSENKGFYIERKIITKKGRYRRIRNREKSKIKR